MALNEWMDDADERFDFYVCEAERNIEAAAREKPNAIADNLRLSLAREQLRRTSAFVGTEETHPCRWCQERMVPLYRHYCSQRCAELYELEQMGTGRA